MKTIITILIFITPAISVANSYEDGYTDTPRRSTFDDRPSGYYTGESAVTPRYYSPIGPVTPMGPAPTYVDDDKVCVYADAMNTTTCMRKRR